MRSEGTAHKMRKRREVLYKIMYKLFYIMRGIGALYEWCAPSSTSHFSHSSAAAEAACVGVMTPCSAMRARTTVMRFAPSFGCEMGS